ncbi:MAG: alpha/beta hydrolase [Burkholderiaceae bacterium]
MLDSLLQLPQAERNAAYDNSAAVPDAARQMAEFEARGVDLLERVEARLDLRYGPAERQAFDYFPGGSRMPTLLFIHGGYWQMRDKNTFRFVLEGALAQGLHGALIGYTLAPLASLSRIVEEVREGVAAVRAQALKEGGSGAILLCGWSAGGHLTAMALGCEGVVAGLGLSGIYDLAPLRQTYLNDALRLTDAEIALLSPLRLPPVAKPFLTAYGTAELAQLQAQSRAFAEHRSGCPGGLHPVAGADHFSILSALASPNGALLKAFSSISAS